MSEDELNRNPYRILQISRDAEPEVVDAAYKSLARKYHPDSGGAGGDPEKMKEINWAHGILKDAAKRSDWDSNHPLGNATVPGGSQSSYGGGATGASNPPPNQSHSEYHSDATSAPQQETPSTSSRRDGSNHAFRNLVIILAGIAIAIWICSSLTIPSNRAVTAPPTSTRRPVPTATRRPPTRTPVNNSGLPLQSSSTSNCIPWQQVSATDVGRKICVYGTIARVYQTEQYAQLIRFSEQPGEFLVRGDSYYFSDVASGECAYVNGIVERTGGYLYMDIDSSTTTLQISSSCY